MLHRSGSNSILGTLAYNNPPLECRCFLLVLNFRQPLAVPSLWAFRLSWLAPHSQCSSEGNHLRPVCPFEIRLFSHDSGAVISGLSIVNLIFLLCCAANDICFFFNIVHVNVLNASRNGKLFLSSLTVTRTCRHKSQIRSVKIMSLRFFR